MSFSSLASSTALEAACKYANQKNQLLIAAAGNYGQPKVDYPAAYNSVISVGAVNSAKELALFSNYGWDLDIVAPGDNILSTMPSYPVTMNSEGFSKNYDKMGGTSMATPHVSAVAGLFICYQGAASNFIIKSMLLQNTDDLGAFGKDRVYGHGLLNARKAFGREKSLSIQLPSILD